MKKNEWSGIVLSLMFLAACSASSGVEAPRQIVLQGATVIDGRGGEPLRNAVVVIAGERITAVGPADSTVFSEEAEVIDLGGMTLIPGLIDTHAHVTFLSDEGSRAVDLETTRAVASMLLDWGITTALNPSAPLPEGVELRDQIARGELRGPLLLTAGPSWDLIGARGSVESLQREVRRQCEAGVDFVKLYAPHQPDEVRAVIEAAHECGIRVIGHLQRTTWTDAARAGIDLITHGTSWSPEHLDAHHRSEYNDAIKRVGGMRARIEWLERVDLDHPSFAEMIQELARRRIPVDPTLVAYETKFLRTPLYSDNPQLQRTPRPLVEAWQTGGFTRDWDDDDFERMAEVWPKMLELTGRYHDGGMLLTVGSDLPNQWVVPGWSLHREMQLLVEAGISPGAVLQMATRNGAMALGLDDRGTIEPGRLADLVVLRADPLTDIRNTMKIHSVWQGGRPVAHFAEDRESEEAAAEIHIEAGDIFPGVESTLAILDTDTGELFLHNAGRAGMRFLPASTFKIVNTLIALETGVVKNPDLPIEWDESLAPRQHWWPKAWTEPQTLATAFSNSVVWYYQALAREIGAERMRDWLKRLEYGNQSIEGGIDRFWLSGGLRISPVEQIDFLSRLHGGELPVSSESLETLEKIMRIGTVGGYELRGKTGTAVDAERELGWLVGYAEKDHKTYIYALNIEGDTVWEEWPRHRRVKAVVQALSMIESRASEPPKNRRGQSAAE